MKGLRACALSTLVASLLVAQQPNHAGASMVINGTDGPPWPITGVSLPQGQASTVTLQGAPNAVFLVAGSPMAASCSGISSQDGFVHASHIKGVCVA